MERKELDGGDLSEALENAKAPQEALDVISETGMTLTDEQLDRINGGLKMRAREGSAHRVAPCAGGGSSVETRLARAADDAGR